jgi:hypothetical protein
MSERLLAVFPGLRTTPFRVTSPADRGYNCIAWACGNAAEWWWPLSEGRRTFWPPDAPREITLEAFQLAFTLMGFSITDAEALEASYERIAVFADAAGRPTHAARQLTSGAWTSKLGQAEDIEHNLRALEGDAYGAVALIMKRPAG